MTSATYFVTDIEADGPDPAKNSMLSFATVACSQEHGVIDCFEAVLHPRADRHTHAETMAWWKTQPMAFKAATADPGAPSAVMNEFANWVEKHSAPRIFAASPVLFDGGWIDEYLKTYVTTRIFNGPFKWRRLFDGNGLDIPSYLGGLFGWPAERFDEMVHQAPDSWRGKIKHTHRAIDDATGYANILLHALRMNSARPIDSNDFARNRK